VTAAGTFVGDLRIVLRGRDFRRLFATRLSSQFADGVFQVGLASLFFFSPERAATPVAVAIALSVSVLPFTLVGPFAGVFLDHWRRRQVLLAANLVRAVLVVAVAVLVGADVVGLWLYGLVLLCLSVNRFFLAGIGASLPNVVPSNELVMANAVSPTCGTLAALLGGAFGYLLRRTLGAGDSTDAIVVLASAGIYLLAAWSSTRMHPDLLGPEKDGGPDGEVRRPWHDLRSAVVGVLHGLGAATVYVWERKPAAHALLAIGAHRFAYGVTTLAIVLLSRNRFNSPDDVDSGLALLASIFAASGLGFGAAALVTPLATQRLRPSTWIVVCLSLAATVSLALLITLTVPIVLAAAFLLGIASQGSKICVDAIVQGAVEDAFRGRTMAFYDVVFNVAFVSAALFAALLLPDDGYSRFAYAIVAAIYAATAVGYGLATRAWRRQRSVAADL
jgi:MFS family permease